MNKMREKYSYVDYSNIMSFISTSIQVLRLLFAGQNQCLFSVQIPNLWVDLDICSFDVWTLKSELLHYDVTVVSFCKGAE